MTTTHHTCDRCGTEVTRDRLHLVARCGSVSGMPIDPRYGRPALDLCPSCAESLGEWLTGPPPPPLTLVGRSAEPADLRRQ